MNLKLHKPISFKYQKDYYRRPHKIAKTQMIDFSIIGVVIVLNPDFHIDETWI